MTAIPQFEVLSSKGARSAWDGIQINEPKRTHTNSGYILGLNADAKMPRKICDVLDKFKQGKNFAARTLRSENGTLYLNGMPIIHSGVHFWTFSTELVGAHVCDIIEYVTEMRAYKSMQSGKIFVGNIEANGKSIHKKVEIAPDKTMITLEAEYKTPAGIVKMLRAVERNTTQTIEWYVVSFINGKKKVHKGKSEHEVTATYGKLCLSIS